MILYLVLSEGGIYFSFFSIWDRLVTGFECSRSHGALVLSQGPKRLPLVLLDPCLPVMWTSDELPTWCTWDQPIPGQFDSQLQIHRWGHLRWEKSPSLGKSKLLTCRKTCWMHVYCFNLLKFEVICYAEEADWFRSKIWFWLLLDGSLGSRQNKVKPIWLEHLSDLPSLSHSTHKLCLLSWFHSVSYVVSKCASHYHRPIAL